MSSFDTIYLGGKAGGSCAAACGSTRLHEPCVVAWWGIDGGRVAARTLQSATTTVCHLKPCRQVVYEPGRPADCFYVILAGAVELFVGSSSSAARQAAAGARGSARAPA